MIFESSEDQWRTGGILSGDSWKDERVVEDSQKVSISKLHIENRYQMTDWWRIHTNFRKVGICIWQKKDIMRRLFHK